LKIGLTLLKNSELRIRDPVPFWPLDPGSGTGKKQDPDPGWITRIIFPRALKTIFWVKIPKLSDADPESRIEKIRIRDGKFSNPEFGINIPDPQHWKNFNGIEIF
jgi:hypothetical protein